MDTTTRCGWIAAHFTLVITMMVLTVVMSSLAVVGLTLHARASGIVVDEQSYCTQQVALIEAQTVAVGAGADASAASQCAGVDDVVVGG